MACVESGEYHEFASDAIGFPIISYDDYKNDCERDILRNSGKCLRPWMFEKAKTIIILFDIANVVLDCILVRSLSELGEIGYASLLGFMTSFSVVVSIWMKFLMYRTRKDMVFVPEMVLGFLLVTQFFIFVMEDVTTIFIFTRVDDDGNLLIDYSDRLTSRLNVWTSILSGVSIGFLLIIYIMMLVFEGLKAGWWGGCSILLPIAAMFDMAYMLFFAIDKILLENSIKASENSGLITAYMFNIVLFSVAILLSNCVINITYMFEGGN